MESVRNAMRRLKKWHSPVRDQMTSDDMFDAVVRHIHPRNKRLKEDVLTHKQV